MKILHILYSGLGGVYDVVKTLTNKKNSLLVNGLLYVGPSLIKEIKSEINKKRNHIMHVKTLRFFSQFYFFQIMIKILQFKPEIIILHNFQIFPSLISKIFHKTKIVYVDHNAYTVKNFRDKIIIYFSKYFMDHYIVLNKENYNLLKKKFKIDSKKISLIENGVNLKLKRKKIKSNNLIIGMASRINLHRRHEVIIKTIKYLKYKEIFVKCYFAGDGENILELKNYVKKLDLKDQIFFDGVIDQNKINNWYKKLNLYIQASNGEGSSISILKAISLGIPVIASNVSGIRNLKFISKKHKFENNFNDLKIKILNFSQISLKKKNQISENQFRKIKLYSDQIMINKYNNLFYKLKK